MIHLPTLYPKQRAAVYAPERYSVIEASTKSGKTVASIVWLLDQAGGGQQGWNYWWVAPVYTQADIAYRRTKGMFVRCDRKCLSGWEASESKRCITLGNGTVVWFKSGEKPDNLYGEDVYAAVMDEASRCREDAWHAIRSTITATRAPVRLIGNVRGRGWHYQLARKAEAGEPGMAYHRILADDAVAAGVLDRREIDDAESILPGPIFRELYYCEPQDDGGNPFGLDAIRRCIADLGAAPPIAWGFDLGKHQNHTVGVGLDVNGYVSGFQRWQTPWKNTRARIKAMIGGTPALIDSTGVGDPIVEELQVTNPNVEGFQFTAPSKQKLMEGLVVAIQNEEVHFPDGPIVNELDTFEYEIRRTDGRFQGVRYLAAPGCHDDCVDALALAVECKRVHGRGVTMRVLDIGDDDDGDWGQEDWGYRDNAAGGRG
jgi:hypothetical protein